MCGGGGAGAAYTWEKVGGELSSSSLSVKGDTLAVRCGLIGVTVQALETRHDMTNNMTYNQRQDMTAIGVTL